MRKEIKNQVFSQERALYHAVETDVICCTFAGIADGESVLKESRDVRVQDCSFSLRYPLWHAQGFELDGCYLDTSTRAPLWYSERGVISHCKITGTKTLRECKDVAFSDCDIKSAEFGWRCENVRIDNSTVESEYCLFESKNLTAHGMKMKGKYSFQYTENVNFDNCVLDTKDAFWHAKNVTVTDSVIKGEYLGWYSDGLTLIRCKISGTQPLCYCKNLTLIDCETEGCDLSFEYSQVNASIKGHIDSIKNPKSGTILVETVGEIIREDAVTECHARILVGGKEI